MPHENFYLSIGSNVAPDINIPACLESLKKAFLLRRVSSIYETPPYGPSGEKKFWNAAVEITSSLDREALSRELSLLEDRHGRRREESNKFAPRTIDLDLLPRKGYQEFAFVMVPLAEIAPNEIDAETGETFLSIADKLREKAAAFRVIKKRELIESGLGIGN